MVRDVRIGMDRFPRSVLRHVNDRDDLVVVGLHGAVANEIVQSSRPGHLARPAFGPQRSLILRAIVETHMEARYKLIATVTSVVGTKGIRPLSTRFDTVVRNVRMAF